MADLASERLAATELIIEEYNRLRDHNKNHKLLSYITNVTEDGFGFSSEEKLQDKFLEKYAPSEETPVAVMLSNYYVDLRKAVDKIEGIDRSPKRPETALNNLESLFSEEGEEDLPF